ncbi:MAG: MFS transporter [Desulfovibrionaceae bacterium]
MTTEQQKFSPKHILLAVCVAQFLLPFMMAGVNAVLPPIGEDLQASARELGLISTLYALGLAVFQLTAGRMGDVWGRRRTFLWGMAIFALSGLTLGFVTDINTLLGIRFIQGAGGAMFNASGLALVACTAPPALRGQYIGIGGAAVYAGLACGPPLAGFITGMLSWRWLFWANGLACAVAFILMLRVHAEWREGKGEPFDWRGSFIYGSAMAAVTIGATSLQDSQLMGWGLLGTGLIGLSLYVWTELHTAYPLLDIRLLVTNKIFGLSSLAAFINYSSFFGMLFFFSVYLQVVRGMSVQEAGFFLAIQSAVQVFTTPWAGRMADKHGAGLISSFGIGCCGLGLLAAAFLQVDSPLWFLAVAQILLGFGISMFAVPNTTVLLGSVDAKHLGQAAGLTGAVRTGGGVLNMMIITMTLGFYLGHQPISAATIAPFMTSMKMDLILFGVLNLLAVGCALGRQRVGKKI